MDSLSLSPGAFPSQKAEKHCSLECMNSQKSPLKLVSHTEPSKGSAETLHHGNPAFAPSRKNEANDEPPRPSRELSSGRRSATLFFRSEDKDGLQPNLSLVLLRGPSECHRRIPLHISPSTSWPLPHQSAGTESYLSGLVVGRSTSCDVVLDPWLVFASSRHALLSVQSSSSMIVKSETTTREEECGGEKEGSKRHTQRTPPLREMPRKGEEEAFWVTDLGSTNGTFVNKYRLPPMKPHPLHHGDTVIFGGMQDVDGFLDSTAMQRSELVVWRVETPAGAADERRLFASLEDEMTSGSVVLDDKNTEADNSKVEKRGKSTQLNEEDGLYEATTLPFRPSEHDLDRYASFLLEAAMGSTSGCCHGNDRDADENGAAPHKNTGMPSFSHPPVPYTRYEMDSDIGVGGSTSLKNSSEHLISAVTPHGEEVKEASGSERVMSVFFSGEKPKKMNSQTSPKPPSEGCHHTPLKSADGLGTSHSLKGVSPFRSSLSSLDASSTFYVLQSSKEGGQPASPQSEGREARTSLADPTCVSSQGRSQGSRSLFAAEVTTSPKESSKRLFITAPCSSTSSSGIPAPCGTDNTPLDQGKTASSHSLQNEHQEMVKNAPRTPLEIFSCGSDSPKLEGAFNSDEDDEEEEFDERNCGPITQLPHLFPVSMVSLSRSSVPNSLVASTNRKRRIRGAKNEENSGKLKEATGHTDTISSSPVPSSPSLYATCRQSTDDVTAPSPPTPFYFTHVRLGKWRFFVSASFYPSQPFFLSKEVEQYQGCDDITKEKEKARDNRHSSNATTSSNNKKTGCVPGRKRSRMEEIPMKKGASNGLHGEPIGRIGNGLPSKNYPFTLSFTPMHWVWCMSPVSESGGTAEVVRCVLPITSIATVLVCPALCGLAVELGAHVKQLPCAVPATVFNAPDSTPNGEEGLETRNSSGGVAEKTTRCSAGRRKSFAISSSHLHRWIVWYFTPAETKQEESAQGGERKRGGGNRSPVHPSLTDAAGNTGKNCDSALEAPEENASSSTSEKDIAPLVHSLALEYPSGGSVVEKAHPERNADDGGIRNTVNDHSVCPTDFFPQWVCSLFFFFHGLGVPEPLCVDSSTFSFLISE